MGVPIIGTALRIAQEIVAAIDPATVAAARDNVEKIIDGTKDQAEFYRRLKAGMERPALLSETPTANADLDDLIEEALSGVLADAIELYRDKNPKAPPAANSSAMPTFSKRGSADEIAKQIRVIFENSNIITPGADKAISQMITTMRTFIETRNGQLLQMDGRTIIKDTPLRYNWALSYGLFPVTPDAVGLIYGFAAGLGPRADALGGRLLTQDRK